MHIKENQLLVPFTPRLIAIKDTIYAAEKEGWKFLFMIFMENEQIFCAITFLRSHHKVNDADHPSC